MAFNKKMSNANSVGRSKNATQNGRKILSMLSPFLFIGGLPVNGCLLVAKLQ